jgi:hypothetical protein
MCKSWTKLPIFLLGGHIYVRKQLADKLVIFMWMYEGIFFKKLYKWTYWVKQMIILVIKNKIRVFKIKIDLGISSGYLTLCIRSVVILVIAISYVT